METERGEMGITWDEAGKMKKDRDGWRELVVALCLTGGDEAE